MQSPSKIELWAGLECTLNRVKDRYVNQCEKNLHDARASDVQAFANLGVKKIRYPFLWETLAPETESELEREKSWRFFDQKFAELNKAGIEPIVGLLHHGSGPRYTNLIDPKFPQKFARYARAFAKRYPDVMDYTPINEPLTTARFSGLYGVWYPHGKDDRVFVRALYQQIHATVLAMQEIRRINPYARLIQTEDLGRAQGTKKLKTQVEFENQRRWLTFDLLAGKVDSVHPLFDYLIDNGLLEDELQYLVENATPPEVCGINHYPLSNRFLDERLKLYPRHTHGGNGKIAYADIGCIETHDAISPTPASLLLETWNRYRLPIAVTEVHARGHREKQIQWFKTIWNAAQEARAMGAEISAVTAWSLLGTYDWNTLCTEDNGFYEAGIFDVSSGKPRPTALAQLLKDLTLDHPDPFRHASFCFTKPIVVIGKSSPEIEEVLQLIKARAMFAVKSEDAFPDILALDPWGVINMSEVEELHLSLERKSRATPFAYQKFTPGTDPHYVIDCMIDQISEHQNSPNDPGLMGFIKMGRLLKERFLERSST